MGQSTPMWLTLLSIGLGGVVSGFVTVFFNARQSERSVRRAKLEELCGLLAALQSALTTRSEIWLRGGNAVAGLQAPLDLTSLYHVQTLIALYVPNVEAGIMPALRRIVAEGLGPADEGAENIANGLAEAFQVLSNAIGGALDAAWDEATALNSPWYFFRLS